jgi:hypothetical protein
LVLRDLEFSVKIEIQIPLVLGSVQDLKKTFLFLFFRKELLIRQQSKKNKNEFIK